MHLLWYINLSRKQDHWHDTRITSQSNNAMVKWTVFFASKYPCEFVCLFGYFGYENNGNRKIGQKRFGGHCKICVVRAGYLCLIYVEAVNNRMGSDIKWPMEYHTGFFTMFDKRKCLSSNESWPKGLRACWDWYIVRRWKYKMPYLKYLWHFNPFQIFEKIFDQYFL